jgi:hypothetical protein
MIPNVKSCIPPTKSITDRVDAHPTIPMGVKSLSNITIKINMNENSEKNIPRVDAIRNGTYEKEKIPSSANLISLAIEASLPYVLFPLS